MEQSIKINITEELYDINPNNIFIEMINKQKQKEINTDIWKDSQFKDLVKLQSNNVGNVGETFIQKICDIETSDATNRNRVFLKVDLLQTQGSKINLSSNLNANNYNNRSKQ